jgi:hypothetical protein
MMSTTKLTKSLNCLFRKFTRRFWLTTMLVVTLTVPLSFAVDAGKIINQQLLKDESSERAKKAVGRLENDLVEMNAEKKSIFLHELQALLNYLNYLPENHDQLWLILLERRRIRHEINKIMFHSGLYATGSRERYIEVRDRIERNIALINDEISRLVKAGNKISQATPGQIMTLHHSHVSRRDWRDIFSGMVGRFEDNFSTAFVPSDVRKAYQAELQPLLNYLNSTKNNQDQLWIKLLQRRLARMINDFDSGFSSPKNNSKNRFFHSERKRRLEKIEELKFKIDLKLAPKQ